MMEGKRKITGYELTRQWYQFVFKTKEMVRPIHAALYFWIVELDNELHWKEIFGLPTQYSMQAIGIRGRQHFQKALDDLIKWGFITLISKATNQHTSNQISLNLLDTFCNKQGYKQNFAEKPEKSAEDSTRRALEQKDQKNLLDTLSNTYKNNKTIKNIEPIVKKININPIPDDAR